LLSVSLPDVENGTALQAKLKQLTHLLPKGIRNGRNGNDLLVIKMSCWLPNFHYRDGLFRMLLESIDMREKSLKRSNF